MVSFLNTTMVLNKHTWIEKKRTNMKYKGGRTKYLLQAW